MKILVVDDERAVLDAYKHILLPSPEQPQEDALQQLAGSLFSDAAAPARAPALKQAHVTFCSQGLEAIEAIERALAGGTPFEVSRPAAKPVVASASTGVQTPLMPWAAISPSKAPAPARARPSA